MGHGIDAQTAPERRRSCRRCGAATGANSRAARKAAQPTATAIVGAFKSENLKTKEPLFALSIVGPTGAQLHSIPLTFHGHGLALDPLVPSRAVLFQKKGIGACELDLVAGTNLRPVTTVPARHFYGHGVFSADGQRLFATETVLATKVGQIIVRDGRSLAIVGELPSFGEAPHDLQLVDGGKVLAITNGGGPLGGTPPNVAFVDAASGKLLEKIVLPGPRINAGHLAYTRAHDLVVVSAQRTGLPESELGGVTVRPHGQPARTLDAPAELVRRLVGETLSVAIFEPSGMVATTTPDANLLLFWTLDGKLKKQVELFHPRGVVVTRDQSAFAVSQGQDADLVFFSTATLEPLPARTSPNAQMSGSHFIPLGYSRLITLFIRRARSLQST